MPFVSTANRFANLPRQVDIRGGNNNRVNALLDVNDPMQRILAASQFAGGQLRQQLVALPALRVDRCAFLVGASARSSMPPAEALVTDETQDFGASLTSESQTDRREPCQSDRQCRDPMSHLGARTGRMLRAPESESLRASKLQAGIVSIKMVAFTTLQNDVMNDRARPRKARIGSKRLSKPRHQHSRTRQPS